MEVVYNACHGGFGLSRAAVKKMAELGSEWAKQMLIEDSAEPRDDFSSFKDTFSLYATKNKLDAPPRHDRIMAQAVRELGSEKASGEFAESVVADVSGNRYRIDKYDGCESVETPESYVWIEVS